MAVLAFQLLRGTGRRLGEIASLRLRCLDVDETGKAVLVYDNHKAGRMSRRLPIADMALVDAIRDQQRWVTDRFATTPPERLWLLPRPFRNLDGTSHIGGNQLYIWIHDWVAAIPSIHAAPPPGTGDPVPFDRSAITPHAFRHTYAQTLADQGVAPSVLRDLMDHRNIDTTLGYYRVSETKKRQAMELLARHTIDHRGAVRPSGEQSSRAAQLREEISWVAVPMGKCSEPTNVRAGGQACPIRYQCAGCPHFESDPSYLPELRGYADELRKEREVLVAFGAAEWVINNVTGQLEVIVDHIHRPEALLETLSIADRDAIDEASRTLRKVRQPVPVAFGRR
ncbi:MAG: tyrosine-type recombinase/integrase, partial [Acidimicrobiales bacterium]